MVTSAADFGDLQTKPNQTMLFEQKYWDTLWSAECGVLSCLSQPADRRPF